MLRNVETGSVKVDQACYTIGVCKKNARFLTCVSYSLRENKKFQCKKLKMQANIRNNFKGLLEAFSRVYDGIMMFLSRAKKRA